MSSSILIPHPLLSKSRRRGMLNATHIRTINHHEAALVAPAQTLNPKPPTPFPSPLYFWGRSVGQLSPRSEILRHGLAKVDEVHRLRHIIAESGRGALILDVRHDVRGERYDGHLGVLPVILPLTDLSACLVSIFPGHVQVTLRGGTGLLVFST